MQKTLVRATCVAKEKKPKVPQSGIAKGDPTAQAQTGPEVKSRSEQTADQLPLRASCVPSVGRSLGLRLSVGVVCGVECQGWLQQHVARMKR